MSCLHGLTERETACADGACPICLRARVERLEQECVGLDFDGDYWRDISAEQAEEAAKRDVELVTAKDRISSLILKVVSHARAMHGAHFGRFSECDQPDCIEARKLDQERLGFD